MTTINVDLIESLSLSPYAALQEAPCGLCLPSPAELIAELLRTDLAFATRVNGACRSCNKTVLFAVIDGARTITRSHLPETRADSRTLLGFCQLQWLTFTPGRNNTRVIL